VVQVRQCRCVGARALRRRVVQLLLSLALVVLDVARGLLRLVASDGADDGILLAGKAVDTALYVRLALSGLDLSLAGDVLLAARVDPGLRACDVADGLDDGALGGVELAGRLGGLVGHGIG